MYVYPLILFCLSLGLLASSASSLVSEIFSSSSAAAVLLFLSLSVSSYQCIDCYFFSVNNIIGTLSVPFHQKCSTTACCSSAHSSSPRPFIPTAFVLIVHSSSIVSFVCLFVSLFLWIPKTKNETFSSTTGTIEEALLHSRRARNENNHTS